MSKEQAREMSEKRPWLSWICESESRDELENKYDSWADKYDKDVEEHWHFIPKNVAQTLSKFLPNKDVSILDAGAGTGLVGEALGILKYTNITAVDLSEGMLVEAKKKQVYKALYQSPLDNTQSFATVESFDAIVAAGVFADAHAGVEALQNLFNLLKKQGIFVLTMRENYRQKMKNIVNRLSWTLVSEDRFPIYDGEAIYILAFKKGRI